MTPVFTFEAPMLKRRGFYLDRRMADGLLDLFEHPSAEWKGIEPAAQGLADELRSAIAAHDAYHAAKITPEPVEDALWTTRLEQYA